MKSTGIICEYNPFHNGHLYHIQQTRELTNCDALICVMSGNFVQRGEPAIIDKWERTKVALQHGVDVVLELPFAYATQSATQFAKGAVEILKLAQVQEIVFGSETNDITTLKKLANIDTTHVHDSMRDGLSLSKAYEGIHGTMHANDILGINYIQALIGSSIEPKTIKRTNNYHDDTVTSSIASATAIRKAISNKVNVDAVTCMATQLNDSHTIATYYPYLRTLLLSLSPTYLQTLFLMDEGIEHHLIQQARLHDDITSFLNACTSRRYTTSRIRRTLIHLLNQTTKQDINTLPAIDFIRVLGFTNTGKQYLKSLKQDDNKIASRFNQIPLAYRQMEMKASFMYEKISEAQGVVAKETQPPIYIP